MMLERLRIEIKGTVQGVGFRPFVYQLAESLSLKGFVTNTKGSVVIEVDVGVESEVKSEVGENLQSQSQTYLQFLELLKTRAPKASRITSIHVTKVKDFGMNQVANPGENPGFVNFEIIESLDEYGTAENITPDLTICNDCKKEIFDEKDRRFKYPFNNCTQCGPRFTIIRSMPYDRKNTTMSAFKMCEECSKEYADKAGRRYHAQPVSCHKCGPCIMLLDKHGDVIEQGAERGQDDAFNQSVSLNQDVVLQNTRKSLLDGEIVAIKGIGGFHLACDANNYQAVERLRNRKKRDTKPFAIMVKDVETALALCEISPQELSLLESEAAPIVLLQKRKVVECENFEMSKNFEMSENFRLGIMLPYTPIHQLLFENGIKALIMTSGNISSEPVCFNNDEAVKKLGKIADKFLIHDRDIYFRNDDSVITCFEGSPYPIRRSRGFVPLGIKARVDKQVLAFGADLKNTFSISKGDNIYSSHHVGDMENFDAVQGLEDGIAHFESIFEFTPEIIACDLHPGYVSTKLAQERADLLGVQLVQVQHHHAHMVSCMVDNDLNEKVLGLILDGTGYGLGCGIEFSTGSETGNENESSIWGGELLEGDAKEFTRIGWIRQVPLLGGDLAVKQPWRNALSWILEIYDHDISQKILDQLIDSGIMPEESKNLSTIYRNQSVQLLTSSAGRLFDAVSALLGIRKVNTHEAQAAMELEWQASQGVWGKSVLDKIEIIDGVFCPDALLRSLIKAKLAGLDLPVCDLALEFHNKFAEGMVELCKSTDSECKKIVLSGGVFQNLLLLSKIKKLLQIAGFEVFIHHEIPCNDGGISVGQCFSANQQFLQ